MVLKFQQDILVMMAEVYILCLFLSVFIDDDVFASGLFLREQDGELGESQSGNLWICNQIYLIYHYSEEEGRILMVFLTAFLIITELKKKKALSLLFNITGAS